MDEPGSRSMHIKKTPTLGGVGIFISFIITLILFGVYIELPQNDMAKLLSLIVGTMVLLFLGIKDDLLVLSPGKKFGGQFFSAGLVVMLTDIRIDDFGQFLGIGEIPVLLSIICTILTFVFIINAFNLTDGIDGLSASIAIVSSFVFGFYFVVNKNYLLALTSFTLIGSLLSFLYFNFSKEKKIFMGDSGSMFVGFLLAFQGIALLGMKGIASTDLAFNNPIVIVLSVLVFPILDTIRVMSIRIKQKRSPFSADRNHIHHKMIDLGLNHKTATLIICTINVMIITINLFVDLLDVNIHIQLLVLLISAPTLYMIPFVIQEERGTAKIRWSIPKITP